MGPYKRGGGGPSDQSYVIKQQQKKEKIEKKTKTKMESRSYNEMVVEATATLADNHTWTNIKPE